MKEFKANISASRQMVQQMQMRDAERLADIPLEETLISETSSERSQNNDETNEDGSDYNSEEDKAEVER